MGRTCIWGILAGCLDGVLMCWWVTHGYTVATGHLSDTAWGLALPIDRGGPCLGGCVVWPKSCLFECSISSCYRLFVGPIQQETFFLRQCIGDSLLIESHMVTYKTVFDVFFCHCGCFCIHFWRGFLQPFQRNNLQREKLDIPSCFCCHEVEII